METKNNTLCQLIWILTKRIKSMPMRNTAFSYYQEEKRWRGKVSYLIIDFKTSKKPTELVIIIMTSQTCSKEGEAES